MKIDSDELEEYIKAVLRGVYRGVSAEIGGEESETFSLSGPVRFQVGITNRVEKDGSVKIYVAGIGAGKSNEEHVKIEFEASDSSVTTFRTLNEVVGLWERISENERKAISAAILSLLQMKGFLPTGSQVTKLDTQKLGGPETTSRQNPPPKY